MGEQLADRLLRLADVLHWLGKYNECNAVILFSRWVRTFGIVDIEDLERFVEEREQLVAAREDSE